jgi:hypothetical protein
LQISAMGMQSGFCNCQLKLPDRKVRHLNHYFAITYTGGRLFPAGFVVPRHPQSLSPQLTN